MAAKTTGITDKFFLYNMYCGETGDFIFAQSEQEMPGGRQKDFKDFICAEIGWEGADSLSIELIGDEQRLQEKLVQWKRPDNPFCRIDVEGEIKKPFDPSGVLIEGILCRRIMSYCSF